MNKFIEKNPLLTVIGVLTLIVSLVLLYFIYDTNTERNSANSALTDLQGKIQRLNYYRPSPTKENIEKIKADLKSITAETSKLEEYFGEVYTKALNAFILALEQPVTTETDKTINQKEVQTLSNTAQQEKNLPAAKSKQATITYELKQKFLTSWTKFVEMQSKKDESLEPSEVLDKFRIFNKYSKEKFQSAINIFSDIYRQSTLEKVTKNNIDDYILAALGLPLGRTRIGCKKAVDDLQKTIEEELRKVKLLSQSEHLVLFNEYTTIPNDDQIPYIVKYCRLYEDLFTRIAKSNIETLVSYKKLNGLRGLKQGNFLIYKYELQIISSLKSTRNFLNSLQSAYKDNRIYVIKDISLENISSKAEKLQPYKKEIKSDKALSKSSSRAETDSQSNKKQVTILLGTSNLIKMDIKFDYIIFDKPLIKI